VQLSMHQRQDVTAEVNGLRTQGGSIGSIGMQDSMTPCWQAGTESAAQRSRPKSQHLHKLLIKNELEPPLLVPYTCMHPKPPRAHTHGLCGSVTQHMHMHDIPLPLAYMASPYSPATLATALLCC
jgi:hypothetical protein